MKTCMLDNTFSVNKRQKNTICKMPSNEIYYINNTKFKHKWGALAKINLL